MGGAHGKLGMMPDGCLLQMDAGIDLHVIALSPERRTGTRESCD